MRVLSLVSNPASPASLLADRLFNKPASSVFKSGLQGESFCQGLPFRGLLWLDLGADHCAVIAPNSSGQSLQVASSAGSTGHLAVTSTGCGLPFGQGHLQVPASLCKFFLLPSLPPSLSPSPPPHFTSFCHSPPHPILPLSILFCPFYFSLSFHPLSPFPLFFPSAAFLILLFIFLPSFFLFPFILFVSAHFLSVK